MNFSTLKIYGTIPFQKDYKHTIDFESKSEQKNYFSTEFNKKGKSFSDFLYIDEYQKIIVEGAKGKFDGYNYLSFVNGDSNRTFYCFIDRFEYVSEDSTAIYFTVDVMQTYMFDYTLKESYVERMHTIRWNSNKTINKNYCYTSEPFSVEEYDKIKLWTEKGNSKNNENLCFLKLTFSENPNENIPEYSSIQLYSYYLPCWCGEEYYSKESPWIHKDSGNKRAIPFMKIPKIHNITSLISCELVSRLPYNYRYDSDKNILYPPLGSGYTGSENIDGTEYCYLINVQSETNENLNLTSYAPYCNTTKDLKRLDNDYIHFTEGIFRNEIKMYAPFLIYIKLTNKLNLNKNIDLLKFTNYNTTIKHFIGGASNATEIFEINNYDDLDRFIFDSDDKNVSFSVDSFREYMNSNGLNNIYSAITNMITPFITGNPLSFIKAGADIAEAVQADIKSDTVKNPKCSDYISSSFLLGNNNYIYLMIPKNISVYFNYLYAYGYNINTNVKPDIKNRYWFNYIKTKVCNITSNLNNEICNAIKDIYNSGITFWHYNGGNYKWIDYSYNNIERSIAT